MKYIDADKLIALIDAKLEDLGMSGSVWVGRSVLNELREDIESLQQEQPSLPSNLDEAANDYCSAYYDWDDEGERKEVVRTFKAGAEWMAVQGETHETEIVSRINARGLLPAVTCLVDNSYKEGDKVVVQIRKK